MYRAVALVLLASLAIGCESRPTPAGPSSERAAGLVAGAIPQPMAGETIPWTEFISHNPILGRDIRGLYAASPMLAASASSLLIRLTSVMSSDRSIALTHG